MAVKPSQDVTRLLDEIGQGHQHAADELLPLIYEELRKLAHSRMAREKPGLTLQATALVHEAYLRLLGDQDVQWDSRGHFFSAAAEAMRRILIERARRYARIKHGGGQRKVTFDDQFADDPERTAELLAIDAAICELEQHDQTMVKVVKLRYFAGLTIEETAKALDMSPRSVNRAWTAARAWLARSVGAGQDHG
jgi:RNA polymerase sigma factor (TIGR02999 family)